jgi:hypothetical protein
MENLNLFQWKSLIKEFPFLGEIFKQEHLARENEILIKRIDENLLRYRPLVHKGNNYKSNHSFYVVRDGKLESVPQGTRHLAETCYCNDGTFLEDYIIEGGWGGISHIVTVDDVVEFGHNKSFDVIIYKVGDFDFEKYYEERQKTAESEIRSLS